LPARRRDGDGDAGPARLRDREDDLLEAAGDRRVGDARLDRDLLHPEPLGRGGEVLGKGADDGGAVGEGGPDVDEDPVPLEAVLGPAMGLEMTNRLERLEEHPFHLREADEPALGVEGGRQVAHLGEREEALVLRVLPRDALEEVDVLGRREPLDVEALEAPEVEALADHRVHRPVELLLDEAAVARPEREVLHAAHAEARAGGREREDDADDARSEPGGVGEALDLRRPCLGVAERAGTPGVDVDEDVVLRRVLGEVGGDVGEGRVELAVEAPGGDDEVADPFERVLGEGPRATPERDLAEPSSVRMR
jgi:hypothetical protein